MSNPLPKIIFISWQTMVKAEHISQQRAHSGKNHHDLPLHIQAEDVKTNLYPRQGAMYKYSINVTFCVVMFFSGVN